MTKFISIFLITIFVAVCTNGICYERQKSEATAKTYFDLSTGHKYIKNADNTYTELTKKGKVFKTAVPATQPHLCSSPYVVTVPDSAYMVYKNFDNYKPVYTIRKVSEPHPEGARSMQVFVSAKQQIDNNIGLGYDQAEIKSIATENAYFDMSTGHRYIKNNDNTYTEYTKKGEVFKTDVPATQPHLCRSRYITAVKASDLLVYTTYKNNKSVYQVQTAAVPHPKSYRCSEILSLVSNSEMPDSMKTNSLLAGQISK